MRGGGCGERGGCCDHCGGNCREPGAALTGPDKQIRFHGRGFRESHFGWGARLDVSTGACCSVHQIGSRLYRGYAKWPERTRRRRRPSAKGSVPLRSPGNLPGYLGRRPGAPKLRTDVRTERLEVAERLVTALDARAASRSSALDARQCAAPRLDAKYRREQCKHLGWLNGLCLRLLGATSLPGPAVPTFLAIARKVLAGLRIVQDTLGSSPLLGCRRFGGQSL